MPPLKLRAIGSSTGVIFPKELLAKLNLKEGDELHIVETSDGILLTPSDPTVLKAIEIAREGMRDYREVFEALAK